MLRPGKPIVLEPAIGTAKAARLLRCSVNIVRMLCESGELQSAFRLSGRERAQWRVSMEEVLKRRGHLNA